MFVPKCNLLPLGNPLKRGIKVQGLVGVSIHQSILSAPTVVEGPAAPQRTVDAAGAERSCHLLQDLLGTETSVPGYHPLPSMG